jgi:kynurenine formamidase
MKEDVEHPRATANSRAADRPDPPAVGFLFAIALVAAVVAAAPCGGVEPAVGPADGRWVDLTHPFDDRTIFWPTERGFVLERGPAGVTPKGYYYAANRFATAEHGGTHLDAPRHFAAAGATAENVPLDRLLGAAAVVDVTQRCALDPVYEVTPDDLVAWERKHGRQLVDVILLIDTGWANRWDDRAAYLGTPATGPAAVEKLRFPGLAAAAARWLVDHRRIRAVGIDTASIDHGPSRRFEAHVTLLGAGVPVFENVGRLAELPPTGAFVAALPMKIAGGSGGPLRIVARLPAAAPER